MLRRTRLPYRETSQDVDDDYTSRNVDLRSQATSRALMSEDDVAGKPNTRVLTLIYKILKFYNTTQETPILSTNVIFDKMLKFNQRW